jgi:hypothetical protein
MVLEEILIDDFLHETDNMKIVNSNIYYTDDKIVCCSDVARLYHILFYKIKMNNFIKKLVSEIENNNKKTQEKLLFLIDTVLLISIINDNLKHDDIFSLIINTSIIFGFSWFRISYFN